MYQIGITRPLRAFHYLTGADFGPEGRLHAHDYRIRWTLGRTDLDPLGFVVDLAEASAVLDAVVADLVGITLNELPDLAGLNPSVEHLARHLSDRLLAGRFRWDPEGRLVASSVRVYETPDAWASWTEDL